MARSKTIFFARCRRRAAHRRRRAARTTAPDPSNPHRHRARCPRVRTWAVSVRRPAPRRATCDGRHPETFTIWVIRSINASTPKRTSDLKSLSTGMGRNRPPVAACNHLPAAYHGSRSSPCRSAAMDLTVVPIVKPDAANFIFGQSHFIKTVEDIHEALVGTVPGIRFGLAFCEASGKRLVRWSGNDEAALALARDNALAIGAGHTFLIFLGDGFFPVNVLAAVRAVPEVCRIYCATANPTQVIVAQTELGRGVLGAVDGASPLAVETDADIAWRKGLLRKLRHKL